MERLDFIFSYWVYAWYLLFWFKIIDTYNPKFAIIVGIVENLAILVLMFYYHTKIRFRILFVIMMIIAKIIPIYTIWNEKITSKDIIATFILFIIYCRSPTSTRSSSVTDSPPTVNSSAATLDRGSDRIQGSDSRSAKPSGIDTSASSRSAGSVIAVLFLSLLQLTYLLM